MHTQAGTQPQNTSPRPRALTSVDEQRLRQASASALLVDSITMASMLGVSESWLRHDRCHARVVPFCRLGGRILYSPPAVQRAIDGMQEGGPKRGRGVQ